MSHSTAISLKLEEISHQLAMLSARMPLSIDSLQSLADLQITLAKSCARIADPQSAVLQDMAEMLSQRLEERLRELVEEIFTDRIEPLMMQIFGNVQAREGS